MCYQFLSGFYQYLSGYWNFAICIYQHAWVPLSASIRIHQLIYHVEHLCGAKSTPMRGARGRLGWADVNTTTSSYTCACGSASYHNMRTPTLYLAGWELACKPPCGHHQPHSRLASPPWMAASRRRQKIKKSRPSLVSKASPWKIFRQGGL